MLSVKYSHSKDKVEEAADFESSHIMSSELETSSYDLSRGNFKIKIS